MPTNSDDDLFDKIEEITEKLIDIIVDSYDITELNVILSIIASMFISVVYSVDSDKESVKYLTGIFTESLIKTIEARELEPPHTTH